jgi:hypothetical protein
MPASSSAGRGLLLRGDRCADGRRAAISIGTVAIAAVVTVTTAICVTAVIAAVVAAIVDLVELPLGDELHGWSGKRKRRCGAQFEREHCAASEDGNRQA